MQIGMMNLNKYTYDITCYWYKAINFNPIYNGIDYSQIIRFYLWDKIGRAIRIENKIDFDEEDAYKDEYEDFPVYFKPYPSKGKYSKRFLVKQKVIFIPFPAKHTFDLIEELRKVKKVRVISKYITDKFSKKDVVKNIDYDSHEKWSQILYDAVLNSLKELGVRLIDIDKELLKSQIVGTVKITSLAEKELVYSKPSALYVHSDNHPPFINYVLAAKKHKIPTFTYQHGLDCEQYYLDDCYADFVGVWSKKRKMSYEKDSNFKPKKIEVIGNIFIENLTNNTPSNTKNSILFLSRPHRPIKCYSPTRNHIEGVAILKAILNFMENNIDIKLTIKLHPMDNLKSYERIVQPFKNRVQFSNESIYKLFTKANVLISEDSTSGAESFYFNIPCIHAHFASNKPVLPFVNYGCALPAFNSEQLTLSLNRALKMSYQELKEQRSNKDNFINDFIPKGNIENLSKFVVSNID
jgi:UDP-N-acetylglucosamine 2-epimerase